MLRNEIINNWNNDIIGYAQKIRSFVDTDYPAWTIKTSYSYGVAIPYEGEKEINESFAKAKIQSSILFSQDGTKHRVIILSIEGNEIVDSFAAFCGIFIDPGENGTQRKKIQDNPISWWNEWKELLGNKNIEERIYDTLGELIALYYYVKNEFDPEWNGPEGNSYDIETKDFFVEVKSTVSKSKKEITISSNYQLYPYKPLFILLCKFEPMVYEGYSIDNLLDNFKSIGYNTQLLNEKLKLKGFEENMSIRRKKYVLHEMLLYKVDDFFPKITKESFVGGSIPIGITGITYTVDLSGLNSIPLSLGDDDEV